MSEFYRKYIDEILACPIVPKHGSEKIYLNIPFQLLKNSVLVYSQSFSEQENSGYQLFYTLKLWKSVAMHFSIEHSCLWQIDFIGNYKGKYDGVGIGSKVLDLLNVRKDVFFDEQYILVGNAPYDFIVKIDNDNETISRLEDVLENKIIEITVRDKALLK